MRVGHGCDRRQLALDRVEATLDTSLARQDGFYLGGVYLRRCAGLGRLDPEPDATSGERAAEQD